MACLFCGIVAGEVPAQVVLETERTLAFRDTGPQAPTHVLVVPKQHHQDAGACADADPALLGELMSTAVAVARQEGVSEGYRIVTNTGESGGQSVFHLHLHVLGGRRLGLLG